jgi:hypothetical protein
VFAMIRAKTRVFWHKPGVVVKPTQFTDYRSIEDSDFKLEPSRGAAGQRTPAEA